MAADFFAEGDDGDIFGVLSAVSPAMRDILCQVDREDRDNLVEKLVETANMKMLTDNRTIMFRAAMDKVDLCLSQVAKARADNICSLTEIEEEMIERAETMLRNLTPADMIQRKCIRRLSNDIMDLMMFTRSDDASFPPKMLRNGVKKKGTVNPRESSVTEAIAHLQHIANMIPDDDSPSMINSSYDHNSNGGMIENTGTIRSNDLTLSTVTNNNDSRNRSSSRGSTHPDVTHSNVSEVMDNTGYRDSDDSESNFSYGSDSESYNGKAESEYEDGLDIDRQLSRCVSQTASKGEYNSSSASFSTVEFPLDRFRCAPSDMSKEWSEGTGPSNTQTENPMRDTGQAEWNDCTWWISFRDSLDNHNCDAQEQRVTNHDSNQPPTEHANHLDGDRQHVAAMNRESESGHTKHSYANQGRVIGRGSSEQSQSVTDSTRKLQHEPERKKAAKTGEQLPQSTAFMPIRVSIRVDNVVTDFDLSEVVKMAGRPVREQPPRRGARRDEMWSTCECSECRTRLDEQDRRINELENLIMQRTRDMKVSSDELFQEVREVKRRVDVHDNRPVLLPTRAPELCEAGRHSIGIFAEPVKADKREGKQAKKKTEDRLSRPRAASFAGARVEMPVGGSNEWRSSNKDVRRDVRNPSDSPKPQRVETRKSRANRNKETVAIETNRPRENTMRDWLSKA